MEIRYVCRHCQSVMGVLNSTSVSEVQLGFHSLTLEERQDIIAYNLEGGMTVKLTCEFCREALTANPELSLISSPLQ
ncbi:MAG: anti-sigma-F factor Fin family protein [Gorillibacterium sp.]|nr:anti-sigma-F factor Fin family protein [Gorillibacterium sp.]